MESTMHEMTMWGLVSDASLLVKIVMIILVLASMVSWYLIIWRSKVLGRLEKQNRQFQLQFRQTADITKLDSAANNQSVYQALPAIYQAGWLEYEKYQQVNAVPQDEIVENVERAMLVNIGEQEVELEKGLSYLATIGSVSPYIGLFGTVWGIMNSFFQIGAQESSSLAVVAPGISEALFATAIGLFAAIPAVIAYNRFGHRVDRYEARLQRFADKLNATFSRQLETR